MVHLNIDSVNLLSASSVPSLSPVSCQGNNLRLGHNVFNALCTALDIITLQLLNDCFDFSLPTYTVPLLLMLFSAPSKCLLSVWKLRIDDRGIHLVCLTWNTTLTEL
jgi:hypothetical protein